MGRPQATAVWRTATPGALSATDGLEGGPPLGVGVAPGLALNRHCQPGISLLRGLRLDGTGANFPVQTSLDCCLDSSRSRTGIKGRLIKV